MPCEGHAHTMHMATKREKRREKRLHMLLSKEEWNMVLELADETGLTVSAIVRQLIRREYRRLEKAASRTSRRR